MADLADCIGRAGIGVPADVLTPLSVYLGEGRAMVLATMAAPGGHLSRKAGATDGGRPGALRQLCLYAEFPSKQVVFPMPLQRPGQASSRAVSLYVMDYVRPTCAAAAADGLQLQYRFQSRFGRGVADAFKRGLPSEHIPYTLVRFPGSRPGSSLDLRFTPGRPASIAYAESVESLALNVGSAVLTGAAAVACLSYVSAGLSGLLLFGLWRGYARLGLCNTLTIVGVAIAVHRERVRRDRYQQLPRFATSASATGFCALFSAIYVALSAAVQLLLMLPLGR